jgi:GWxTD domain-containing protein
MKKLKYLVVVLIWILCFNLIAQTRVSKKNIEQYLLSAYTATIDNSDSIRVSIFMQIPYNSIQFVKRDTQFISQYEAAIAIQTKKGNQLGREIWQDSIIVDEYNLTKSNSKNRTLMASYKVPYGKYKIVGTLLDKDTKKVGKNYVDIDLKNYKNKLFLHTPILLEKFQGNWGYGEDLIPAINNQSFNIENGLLFFLTGRTKVGKYIIVSQFLNNQDELLFEDIINDTTNTGYFNHTIHIPIEKINGIKVRYKAELIQDDDNIEKSITVTLKKVGISHLVFDIDEALNQMHYILDNKERKKIRNTSKLKSEKLFRELWKKRDPTPNTSINELMNEYYKRVNYANVQFSGFREGWETDMGMVYIILGPPDDIEKYIDDQHQEPFEAWYYHRIQETYIFIGDNYGNYSLMTPFFGYRR